MSSINKSFYHDGFCPVDGTNVTIEITYLSVPKINFSDVQQFCKIKNKCWYLNDGKCKLKQECPIYKDAPAFKTLNDL